MAIFVAVSNLNDAWSVSDFINATMLNYMKYDINSFKSRVRDLAHGVEREALRTYADAKLAYSFHPIGLGSKLTHPYITTDYAESLMEFVTPAQKNHDATLKFLNDLHYMTYHHAPKEYIWPGSMPCLLPEDEYIDVADYGDSNVGKMKSIYRIGLGYRYGRSMQTIAGIHYNVSLPKCWVEQQRQSLAPNESSITFYNNLYFHMIRNFRRHNWIISYFYGSTPLVDESFLIDKKHNLVELASKSWGLPYATSLRMGGLGYTSEAQNSISVCFNGIESYLKSVELARNTSYPPYEQIGVKVNGRYNQLTSNLLQIDNEFYSRIRPKRVRLPGENSLVALDKRGIEYLEVRLLDVNPYSRVGLEKSQMKFIDLFLLHCLFNDSPLLDDQECENVETMYDLVVTQGRDPKHQFDKKAIAFLKELKQTSEKLDFEWDDTWDDLANDSNSIFSSRVLNDVKSSGLSYLEWFSLKSKEYKKTILATGLSDKHIDYYDCLAKDSIHEQAEIEQQDILDFETYLANFYKDTRLNFND
jgi:glutamate--cysteine ligase